MADMASVRLSGLREGKQYDSVPDYLEIGDAAWKRLKQCVRPELSDIISRVSSLAMNDLFSVYVTSCVRKQEIVLTLTFDKLLMNSINDLCCRAYVKSAVDIIGGNERMIICEQTLYNRLSME